MLREKVVEWIRKTFGGHKAGDRFEMSSKIAEKNDKGMMVRIEELNFIFQRRKVEVTEKEIRQWKEELDNLSGNSLRGFHFENGDIFGLATQQDIEKGVPAGSLVTGNNFLLSVGIFKKEYLAKSLLFPGKINSNRRH
ncbi:hypothetical protein KAT51_01105 [bacterium]|nr:hypothetical protein [bacterium]